MLKITRRLISVGLVMVMVLSLVFGLTAFTTKTTPVFKKKLTISWEGWNGTKIKENGPIQKKLEQMFNVKFNIVREEPASDRIKLLLATGDVPDFFDGYGLDTNKLFKDGIIRGIPTSMIKKYAPGQSKLLDSQPAGWLMLREPGRNDSLIGIMGIDASTAGCLLVPIMRLDWIEKSPVKPKGTIEQLDTKGKLFMTKQAFTIDELEKILNFFANGDPDRNGKKDTFGLIPGSAGLDTYTFATIMGSFGLCTATGDFYNYNIDGKIYSYMNVPILKDALKLARKWYKMGIIDPEFITNNYNKAYEKLGSGKGGYFVNQFSYLDYDNPGMKTYYPRNIIDRDPNAKILIAPPEIGKKQGEFKYRPLNDMGYPKLVSKMVDDEKLQRILQIYDYVAFDKQGYVLSKYGVEGVNFKWTGKAFESPVEFINKNDPGYAGYEFFAANVWQDLYMMINNADKIKKPIQYFQYGEGVKYAYIKPYKMDIFNMTSFTDVMKQYGTTLTTMYNEFVANAITGKVDIDSGWNDYVKKWTESGGDKLLNEIQKMPTIDELAKIGK